MAEGATTENDGKLWKIVLRPGLKFHDGSAVLARDCVASIQRWGKRDAFGQALLAATDELSAPDDKTIQFRLKRPFPLLPDALGKCTAFPPSIMPERIAKTDAFTQVTEMVGSGPYKFVPSERLVGTRTVYERFADYKPRENGTPQWTSGPKIANFDRVEWVTIPDTSTAASALQTGEIDWLEQPSPDLQPLLAKDKSITVAIKDPTGAIAIMRMNQLVPPFDNPAIRRALLGAIDQEDYMVAVAGSDKEMWQTGVGVFLPGSPLANDAGMEVLNGKRDLEKVKRELKAAGYKDEKIVILGVTDLANLKAEGDVGSDMLMKCGMNVDYQTMDWGTVVAASRQEGAAGARRVEHLLHRLGRHRHAQPRRPFVAARQRARQLVRLADGAEARGAAQRLDRGAGRGDAKEARGRDPKAGAHRRALYSARPILFAGRLQEIRHRHAHRLPDLLEREEGSVGLRDLTRGARSGGQLTAKAWMAAPSAAMTRRAFPPRHHRTWPGDPRLYDAANGERRGCSAQGSIRPGMTRREFPCVS